MTFDDFIEEVRHHELMLKVMLEYQNADNICEVSQSEVAHRINKNKTWVSKAIERLNAEDLCVEQIKNGKYNFACGKIWFKQKNHSNIHGIFGLPSKLIPIDNFYSKE